MSRRTKMLASVIREIIAPVLSMSPKKCGIVSITEVEVSEDFSHATVFISSLYFPDKALKYLNSSKNKLQKNLGSIGRFKIPVLRFRLDERIERGDRIDILLKNENNENNENNEINENNEVN